MAEGPARVHPTSPGRTPLAALVALSCLLVATPTPALATGSGATTGATTGASSTATVEGPLRFEAGEGVVLELSDGRRFLDTLELRGRGDGTLLVNELSMDAYVEGVAEMPSRWHLEALKAQAVAARTYAWYSIRLGTFADYDICATVACQVFRGADVVLGSSTGERWREAVAATRGQVLLDDDGLPILARYFSTSGGRTYPNELAFPQEGPRPYLVGTEDPADAVSPYHRWQAVFSRDEFDDILARGETLGPASPIADIERDGSVHDPTATIRVTGQDGTTAEVPARDFREFVSRVAVSTFPDRFPGPRADRLRPLPDTLPSSRYEFEVTDDEVIVHGRGWGHGVGMGQYGALGRAEEGEAYEEILAAYYDGRTPTTSDDLPARVRVGTDAADEVSVRGAGPVRIVAGGEVIWERALGRWTAARDGGSWTLTPPEGHDDELTVTPTRPAPGLDTADDAIVVETEVNKPALLRLEVTDTAGETVLRRDLGVADPGLHAATWRYEDDGGSAVPVGRYALTLVAEDAAGDRAGEPHEVTVERTRSSVAEDLRGQASSLPVLAVVLVLAAAAALLALRRRAPRRPT
jgi:SpoIID/LytB domain protein